METPRVRITPREVPLSPYAFAKSPSTSPAALAVPSRRAIGSVNPLLDNSASKKHFANTSTLNLFADPNNEGDINAEPSPRRTRGLADHNTQSLWTQEWPKSSVRLVPAPLIVERGKGLRIVPGKGDSQTHSIHVVGSSPPAQTHHETPSRGIRCHVSPGQDSSSNGPTPNMRATEDVMGRILRFDAAILADVERKNTPKRPAPKSHTVDRMQQIRVAVTDHVMRRKGGIAPFYVALSRGMVGVGNASVPQTPRSAPLFELSRVEEERRQLTLESLRDQLEALTRCALPLRQLAAMLWDMEGIDVSVGDEGDALLACCPVSFHDFATTFATVGDDPMLKAHKY